ncbi:MAG TPA: hypothetical protein VME69_05685 [Methylocella sp.]|nr:hypothetical protein [Methylocella sp.]
MGSRGNETHEAGVTSGSAAAGTNVKPSTIIQKQHTGRSSSKGSRFKGSSTAAGAPGIAGQSGTQSGPSSGGQPLNK